jgi:hypothetical protein
VDRKKHKKASSFALSSKYDDVYAIKGNSMEKTQTMYKKGEKCLKFRIVFRDLLPCKNNCRPTFQRYVLG